MATKKSSPKKSKKPAIVAEPAPEAVAAGPVRLPGVLAISRTALQVLNQHKKLFLGIALTYIICNFLMVQSVNSSNLLSIKHSLDAADPSGAHSVSTGLNLYTYLLVGIGNGASQAGSAFESILLLVISLALIWALRESMAGHAVRIRDSFYKGMYPLIPSVLVVLLIFVQLLPLAFGSFVYGVVARNGLATSSVQLLLWAIIPLAGLCISTYWLLSSLFAAYIVTLPDMTPMKALRSARKLVKNRRWTVLRKLIFMPLVLVVVGALVMIPFVLWLTFVAPWVFFLLSTIGLVLAQAYMYSLYRELLV